jgi:CRISPR-associated protein Csh1
MKVGERVEKIKDFLKKYEPAFDIPDKKATFLLGVLTKFLLDVQFATRQSTPPFRSKLYGLRLDEGKLRRLFPEIVEKLEEYDVSYPQLQEYVSKTLIEAESIGWRLSKDEISYYFALGLNLGGAFK